MEAHCDTCICFTDKLQDPTQLEEGTRHKRSHKTERAAAEYQFPRSGTNSMKVLHAHYKADGLTDHELADVTGLYHLTAEPSRGRLCKAGWLQKSDRTRPSPYGRECIVWEMTREGRRDFADYLQWGGEV